MFYSENGSCCAENPDVLVMQPADEGLRIDASDSLNRAGKKKITSKFHRGCPPSLRWYSPRFFLVGSLAGQAMANVTLSFDAPRHNPQPTARWIRRGRQIHRVIDVDARGPWLAWNVRHRLFKSRRRLEAENPCSWRVQAANR
jgi:hypothetical protein